MSVHRYLTGRLMEVVSPAVRTRSQPLANWAVREVRLDGKPFAFAGHAYLRAIYDDVSPHVVLIKAAQIGGTTWAILRSIHACLSGLHVMYLFPTRSDVIEFSKSRVRPLIEENAFLQKAMTDTDTAGLKRIEGSYLYLRGMRSPIGIKSVPADMIVFDELDEATPDAKTRAKERLSHSSYKRVIELSNPSIPDYGIDAAYQESDQRHWHLKCPACGEWTAPALAFPRGLNDEVRIIQKDSDGTAFLACPECDAPLDPEAGEWVATHPGRESHGYLISQLFSTLIDPGEILREYEATRFPDRFYNLKIGIAWVDRANRLSTDEVLRLCGPTGMLERSSPSCTMGVDTGRELHVVIARPRGDRREIVYIGVHAAFDELDDLIARFNVYRCVVDGLPETHAARELAARQRGTVFLNFFAVHQRGRPRWDKDSYTVAENRTEALDASRRAIRDGEIVLPRRCRIVDEFAKHLTGDAKQLVEDDETGAQHYRYVRVGTNHFSMALTYECIAAGTHDVIDYVPLA